MQKIILLFAALAIFLGCSNIAGAGIYRNRNDLVVTSDDHTEIIRHKDVFDPSIKKDELNPEKAMALIAGEAKEFPATKEWSGTDIQKISFWHFPIRISATNGAPKFVLKDGVIQKIIPPPERSIKIGWIAEILLRIIPAAGIAVFIFSGASQIGCLGIFISILSCMTIMAKALEQNGWADSAGGDLVFFLLMTCVVSLLAKHFWNKKRTETHAPIVNPPS